MLLEKLLRGLDVRVDSVGLCKVSPGWRLMLPGPRSGAMVHFVLTGTGEIIVPGTSSTQHLERRWMVVVPKGVSHGLQCGAESNHELRIEEIPASSEVQQLIAGDESEQAVTVACGRLRADYAESLDLFGGLRAPVAVDLSDSRRAVRVFEEILDQQAWHRPGYRPMVDSLMFQGLVMFLRRLCEGEDCPLPWLEVLDDPRLARVLDHVLDDPGKPHSVESLSGIAGMSRSAFAETFVAGFGESPKRFVNSVRMHEARDLLRRGDLGVEQVARRLGYSSRSHFSRLFADRFGVPPAEFRRR